MRDYSSQVYLYHYTDIHGLIGIVKSRELWATDYRFLNDSMEIVYALRQSFKDDARVALFVAGLDDLLRAYITSFCEEDDLLSQWRAYGRDGGYCLEFHRVLLQFKRGFEVVEYSDDVTDLFQKDPVNKLSLEDKVSRILSFKHPRFREEREWRHIWFGDPENPGETKIEFRPSALGPVPYVSFPFNQAALRAIVIGPGEHTQVRKAGVNELLSRCGFSQVEVRVSETPLRTR